AFERLAFRQCESRDGNSVGGLNLDSHTALLFGFHVERKRLPGEGKRVRLHLADRVVRMERNETVRTEREPPDAAARPRIIGLRRVNPHFGFFAWQLK